MQEQTIAVTGLGVVSPIACGGREVLSSLEGQGVGWLTLFEPPGKCEHAAEVVDYDWQQYLSSRQTYASRCTELAVGAARMALEDSGRTVPLPDDADTGISFATCWGCIDSAEKFYEAVAAGKGKSGSSLVFSHSYPNCSASLIAIELGLKGYSNIFTGNAEACNAAFDAAVNALLSEACDSILVGASEALTVPRVAHMQASGALPDTEGLEVGESDTGEAGGELWDRCPGEAAVFIMLEKKDRACPDRILGVVDGQIPDDIKNRVHIGDAGSSGLFLNIVCQMLK